MPHPRRSSSPSPFSSSLSLGSQPWRSALLPCALALAACSGPAEFSTRYAPEFAHAPHTVSLLGVYKDGRMNSDAWEQIGAGLSAPLGGKCGPGYDSLVASNQELSGAIDDYARANGIGDELLDQLGPAAQGDLIMVVTIAGRVSQKGQDLPDTNAVAGGPPSTMGSKYRGGQNTGAGAGGRGGSGAMRRPRALADGAAFEMSASLFSVKDHRSVAMVAMEYSGPSVDDAVAKMATKLGVELPGTTCSGWNWGVQIDDHRIRDLVEH
jgi:hypothetical protein